MLLTPTAKKLTSQYMDGTLAPGDYYFSVADCQPRIGSYCPPSTAQKQDRINKQLPPPKARIYSGAGLLVGALNTVTILARVPNYDELTKEQKNGLES